MKNIKKAIVLDMDETLETGDIINNKQIMILRPNLDNLIAKLKEAKKQGIVIILCTTACDEWVEKFLTLEPDFRTLFDKKYTRNNENEWRNFSKEKYPLEYAAKNKNINLEALKPVTTFGFDSILYMDDNKLEGIRLQMIYEMSEHKLEKDVTFYSVPRLKARQIDYSGIIENEMCSEIDNFINKKFRAGLNIV